MVITSSGVSAMNFSPAASAAGRSTDSTSSFAGQLAAAIENYLSQSDNGSRIEIGIQSGPDQGSGVRQYIVTVRDSGEGNAALPSTGEAAAAVPAVYDGPELDVTKGLMYSGSNEYIPRVASDAPDAPRTATDAYWATQPPELRELRSIQNEADRMMRAQELSLQGFPVDVDIMVWGQDPLTTMHNRETLGYTWVPALGQNPVTVVPGMSFPGMPSYDPANPPAGSIRVSTEFGRGLEETSPLWEYLQRSPAQVS